MILGKPALLHIVRHPSMIAACSVLIFASAILGGIIAFVWYPAHTEALAASERLERSRAQLRELRLRAQLAQNYALRLAEAEEVEGKLREAKSEPAFVRDVEALSARTGSALEQVSSSERGGAPRTAFFELTLRGEYANIRQFIAGLPQLKQFAVMERVSMERDAEAIRAFLVIKTRYGLSDSATQ